MVNIEMYIEKCKDSNNHILFSQNIIRYNTNNLMNMDDARLFVMSYLPNKLKDIEYSLVITSNGDVVNIKVIFNYNKGITRECKIKEIVG